MLMFFGLFFWGMGDAYILKTISSKKTSQILSRQSYRLKSTVKLSGSDEDDALQYSQVAGSGWVPGHVFGRKVEVRVRTVEEGLATLTVGEVGLKNQTRTRAGLRVQRTAADRQAILHIKTEETETERGKCLEILMWKVCVISFFDFESFLSSQLATRPSDYHFQTFGFPSQAVMEHFRMNVKKNCTHFQQTAFWALCLESTAQTTGFSFLQKAVVHTLGRGGGGLPPAWKRYHPLWYHKGLCVLRYTFWKADWAKAEKGGVFNERSLTGRDKKKKIVICITRKL